MPSGVMLFQPCAADVDTYTVTMDFDLDGIAETRTFRLEDGVFFTAPLPPAGQLRTGAGGLTATRLVTRWKITSRAGEH